MHALAKMAEMAINRRNRQTVNKNSNELAKGPSLPPKFEHKLRRHKQSFGKIATTVVLDEDGNLL